MITIRLSFLNEISVIACLMFPSCSSELKEAVEKLVLERDQLASEVDDLKQVTEAAKRERVLAIDEKDHLLRE